VISRSILRSFRRDARGVAAVEFALVAPALLLTIMGIFDLGYNIYANTMVQGAIQRAARDSTIEGADARLAQIDTRVTDAVRQVVPSATIAFSRRAYANFTDVALAEDFTDSDDSGKCDNGEPFEDANRNGAWDTDRGLAGQGGARDAVLYSVTVTYPRGFPMAKLIGLPETVSTDAVTVLRNQPYNLQDNRPAVGTCA
jgi:Flp pilus assembly protein TadG